MCCARVPIKYIYMGQLNGMCVICAFLFGPGPWKLLSTLHSHAGKQETRKLSALRDWILSYHLPPSSHQATTLNYVVYRMVGLGCQK